MKNRKTSFTERLAAIVTIAIFLFPDVSASAHALSQRPWQNTTQINVSTVGLINELNGSADVHTISAMQVSGASGTVFLGGHANDALNKPTDDVLSFRVDNWDLETNAQINFRKSNNSPVGVTINGQHYFNVQGSSVVVSVSRQHKLD